MSEDQKPPPPDTLPEVNDIVPPMPDTIPEMDQLAERVEADELGTRPLLGQTLNPDDDTLQGPTVKLTGHKIADAVSRSVGVTSESDQLTQETIQYLGRQRIDSENPQIPPPPAPKDKNYRVPEE